MSGFDAVKQAVSDVEAAQAAEATRVSGAISNLDSQISALQAQVASLTGLSDSDAQALADRLEAVVNAANGVQAPAPAPNPAPSPAPAPASN